MTWTVEVEARAQVDLDHAYSFFLEAALDLGEDRAGAARSARTRLERTIAAAARLAVAAHVGTLHDDIAPGLRHVTIDGAIFWFRPDVASKVVRIIGIFHGGQDHLGRMLARLTAE